MRARKGVRVRVSVTALGSSGETENTTGSNPAAEMACEFDSRGEHESK